MSLMVSLMMENEQRIAMLEDENAHLIAQCNLETKI